MVTRLLAVSEALQDLCTLPATAPKLYHQAMSTRIEQLAEATRQGQIQGFTAGFLIGVGVVTVVCGLAGVLFYKYRKRSE